MMIRALLLVAAAVGMLPSILTGCAPQRYRLTKGESGWWYHSTKGEAGWQADSDHCVALGRKVEQEYDQGRTKTVDGQTVLLDDHGFHSLLVRQVIEVCMKERGWKFK